MQFSGASSDAETWIGSPEWRMVRLQPFDIVPPGANLDLLHHRSLGGSIT